MISFPQTESLYIKPSNGHVAKLKQRCLQEIVDPLLFKAYQDNLPEPYFCLIVNHPVFQGQSLKTESFLCIHEDTIYRTEFKEKMLALVLQHSTGFKPTKTYVKEDRYWLNQTQIIDWIKSYTQEKFTALLERPIGLSDAEFFHQAKDILSAQELSSLQKIRQSKSVSLPVLDVLQPQNPALLTQPDFLEKLEAFLSFALANASQLSQPITQRVGVALSRFEEKSLNELLNTYSEYISQQKYKNESSAKLLPQLFKKPKQHEMLNATQSDYNELASYFSLGALGFKALELQQKKDMLYYIFKSYNGTRIIEPQGGVILNAGCDLYASNPALLEYRALSALIEVHKHTPLEPDDPLITKLAGLVPLIPNLPPYEKLAQVKKMLYKKDPQYKLTNQVEERLMPLFETVMLKQMLERDTTKTGITKRTNRV